MNLPKFPPGFFMAGDTVQWLLYDPDRLPADGWVAKVAITNATENHQINGSDNGDGQHLLSLANADTTAITPADDYTMAVYLDNGTERITKSIIPLRVKPDITAGNVEGRSQIKQILDAIDACIAGNATTDQWIVRVDNKEIRRYQRHDLIVLRDKYQELYNQELRIEKIQQGNRPKTRILVRMQ